MKKILNIKQLSILKWGKNLRHCLIYILRSILWSIFSRKEHDFINANHNLLFNIGDAHNVISSKGLYGTKQKAGGSCSVRGLPAEVGTGRPKFSSAALCQSPADRGVHVGPQMDLL